MPDSEFLTQIGGEEFKHWGKLYQIRLSHSSETWKFYDKTLRDIKNIKEICISATFDDMTRFYVLASSSEERKLAIESGCAEVINWLQQN